MEKGIQFKRDGQTYEILQDGAEYVAENKAMCVRPKGKTRGIRIEVAIQSGIIGRVGQSACSEADETGTLFEHAKKNPATVGEQPDKTIVEPEPEPRKIISGSAPVTGTYYIPVSEVRAQIALAQGILCPTGYQDDEALGRDVVASSRGILPLFVQPPQLSADQVLLHVLLTEEEAADSPKADDCLQFSYPLPISRILRIGLHPDVGDPAQHIAGWVEPDVPAPRHLCALQPADPARRAPNLVRLQGRMPLPTTEVRDMLRRYDRYLGLFAYLRNAARYLSRVTGAYADYPGQYFQLSRLLFANHPELPKSLPPVPDAVTALLDVDVQIGEVPEQLVALAGGTEPYIQKEAARELALKLYEANGKDQTLQQAFKALFDDDYREAARILGKSTVPPEAAMLAALFAFSDRQSNDHRNVKQTLHTDWPNPHTVAHVTSVLGAYYGYRTLDALETRLYSVEPFVADFVDPKPPIKYHLESAYERQLIEAVYQWAFFRRKLDTKTAEMLSRAPVLPEQSPARVHGVLVSAKNSYKVADLNVRAYDLSPIARCLRRLLECPGDTVDQSSEVGNYLMARCIFHADEYELSRKSGRETIKYSIRKGRIVDLIKEEKLRPSVRVMNAALDADTRGEE